MRPSGCDVAWMAYSEAIFEAFREANPYLLYKNHHPCVLEAQQRRHLCPNRSCQGTRGGPLDHDELCRFPDNEKIIISHPYTDGEHDEFSRDLEEWNEKLPGLAILTSGAERSWYFPRHSTLVIVGQQAVLQRINLNYPLPTGAEPTGCDRWPKS